MLPELLHHRQDVAARRQLDAVALRLEIRDLGQWMRTGPDERDDLTAGLVFERIEQPLRRRGEIRGILRSVFLEDDLCLAVGGGQRLLERGDPVAAERVVLRQGRDRNLAAPERDRGRQRVLRRVARSAENIPVPFFAGDRVRDRRLHDQDLLGVFGDRKHRKRRARGGGADRQIHLVVRIGLFQQRLGDIRLALVVLSVSPFSVCLA